VPDSGANELRDVTESEIQAPFDSVAPEHGWRLEFYEGSVGQTLVKKAENATLLVIGTREHTGIDRVHGSVCHYCLTRAQCPSSQYRRHGWWPGRTDRPRSASPPVPAEIIWNPDRRRSRVKDGIAGPLSHEPQPASCGPSAASF
jgi:Universal stress protein family